MTFHVPNNARVKVGRMASSEANGNNGMFLFRFPKAGANILALCLASDGLGWEHVSVSLKKYKNKRFVDIGRCPTWDEMSAIKSIFWDSEDAVIQFHPPAALHINNHPYCLHLWRLVDGSFPLPTPEMVGLKHEEVRQE